MAELRPWRWGRPRSAPDPELEAIFPRDAEPDLLEAATLIHRLIGATPRPQPDPAFQARLRARLVGPAARHVPTRRRRPWGLALGAGSALAAAVAVAVVLVEVVGTPPHSSPVSVTTQVSGQRQVPVTQPITLHFNQAMDEAAVDKGLTIAPAVAFKTSWTSPTTLVISPANGLAPNQTYVVSIAKSAAVSAAGNQAAAAIVIPFGTSTTPTPVLGQPPALVSATEAATTSGPATLGYAPDGALLVLASGGLLPPPTAGASPSPSPTTSPSASPTSSSPGHPAVPSLYALNPAPQLLATDVTMPSVSPDSQNIAYWSPQPNGLLALEVVPSGGGSPHALATSAETDPGLAWLDSADLLYSAAGNLWKVSLDGLASAAFPSVQLDPTGFFSLAPGGSAIFTTSGGVPSVYDLATGLSNPLTGILGVPTWSASGAELAYVAASGGRQSIVLASGTGSGPAQLLIAGVGVGLSAATLDPSGQFLVYTASALGATPELVGLNVRSKVASSISGLTGVSDPVWAPAGDQVSVLTSGSGQGGVAVETLLLSGTAAGSAPDPQAGSALVAASKLAQLQVNAPPDAAQQIQSLLGPGLSLPPTALLPGHFDRFFVLSSTASASSAGVYMVDLHLVRDATSNGRAAYLDEQVTVQTSTTPSLITALSQGRLTPIPIGPVVVQATLTSQAGGGGSFTITFNSDLDRGTVGAQSISLSAGAQALGGLEFSYSALTRTVTVSVPSLPQSAVTLTVGPPLADVHGTLMQSPYQVVLQAGAKPAP
ncbi:MAG: Ig-like domain-containing protein [Candidatus Dormibacteria bacterium]